MTDEPQEQERVEVEVPEVTAPVLPVEVVLHNSVTFYQRMIGGGMQLKFVPLIATPEGYAPSIPATVIEFSAEAWERFQREVAGGGVKAPAIQTVRRFPEGLNGHPHG